jgi:magnesium-transporting ATPase (P-type)
VVRDGTETEVPVEDVTVGDDVVIRPGEKIPVDAVVLQGGSAVDESMVTALPGPRSAITPDRTSRLPRVGSSRMSRSTAETSNPSLPDPVVNSAVRVRREVGELRPGPGGGDQG